MILAERNVLSWTVSGAMDIIEFYEVVNVVNASLTG